jgi:hypothetical protein
MNTRGCWELWLLFSPLLPRLPSRLLSMSSSTGAKNSPLPGEKIRMTSEQFENYARSLIQRADLIWQKKVNSYTGGAIDPLENFKVLGKMLGLDPKVVACVYLTKHIFSLCTQARGGEDGGEGYRERCADAVNFLRVVYALAGEEMSGQYSASPLDEVSP